jgi:hypothetical protein
MRHSLVPPCSPAIHAYCHATGLQRFRELLARELAALIAVEDLGLPKLAEGLLQRLHAERGAHADRHPV